MSRKGHKLVFFDADSASGIAILSANDKYKIALNETKDELHIVSKGKLVIEARELEIKVDAGRQDRGRWPDQDQGRHRGAQLRGREMAQPLVMGDKIQGQCSIHQIPNPASGAPQPAPPMPFSAPLLMDLEPTVTIGGKAVAVMGSNGLNTPPHVGLHPSDPSLVADDAEGNRHERQPDRHCRREGDRDEQLTGVDVHAGPGPARRHRHRRDGGMRRVS